MLGDILRDILVRSGFYFQRVRTFARQLWFFQSISYIIDTHDSCGLFKTRHSTTVRALIPL